MKRAYNVILYKMWDLSQNDRLTSNILMHIIIYSTVYKKKRICIRIGSAGLYIYFGIRATVKLLKEKKGFIPFLILCRDIKN